MYWTNIAIGALLFFYVIVCALMGLVIMMQRGKQEGLGAAFGGGMMDSTFGAQTSQVLVRTTVWLAALFFIISISLARLYSHKASMVENGSPVQKELFKAVAPAATPATAPAFPTNAASQPVVPTATPMTATPTAPASAKPAAK